MFMTFVDQNDPTIAIRMALIRPQGSSTIELRHEIWNNETLRYQISSRTFYQDQEMLRRVVQARLKFIKTFLPNLKELKVD